MKRNFLTHEDAIITEEYIERMKEIQDGYKENNLIIGTMIEISQEEAERAIKNVVIIAEGIEALIQKI